MRTAIKRSMLPAILGAIVLAVFASVGTAAAVCFDPIPGGGECPAGADSPPAVKPTGSWNKANAWDGTTIPMGGGFVVPDQSELGGAPNLLYPYWEHTGTAPDYPPYTLWARPWQIPYTIGGDEWVYGGSVSPFGFCYDWYLYHVASTGHAYTVCY